VGSKTLLDEQHAAKRNADDSLMYTQDLLCGGSLSNLSVAEPADETLVLRRR
jgi:hypothetical protein